ncbi:signal peptidase I [gamma proteobacterium HTCC5015]|nr:signal peptidase I [gamma proteobacterium HTCC5015]
MDIHYDFAFYLTAATLVTGIIALLDKLFGEKKRLAKQSAEAGQKEGKEDKAPWLIDFSRSFFPVLALVLVIRSFVAEPFRIPSGSMIPTLLVGDFIVVTKYSYGIRLPVTHHKVVETGEPQRGDVAVFRYPEDPSIDYIKRIVGVPGDSVIYRDDRLFINGEEILSSADEPFSYNDVEGRPNRAVQRLENLLGVEHTILNHPGYPSIDAVRLNIPEGYYFAMGDNRNRSRDSRMWGLVPEKNLVGKAQFIWMHWGIEGLDRIGSTVK